jgi:hypothetical protein
LIVSDKRSYINPERQKELNKPNAVYIISCVDNEFYCENHPNGICQRGFFSLFVQVAYGISFARKNGLPFYVDFGNTNYPYTTKTGITGENNFWNYYFSQKRVEPNQTKVFNLKYETYPIRVWDKGYISRVHHQAISQLKLSDQMMHEVRQIQNNLSSQNVLGVHIRKTDHSLEVKPATDKKYFKLIDKKLKRFDQLFVATDDLEMLETLKSKYPDKISYNSFLRSSGTIPLHMNPQFTDGYLLGKEALLDCYSLAGCKNVLLSPSNLSYAALLLNPSLNYQLIESRQARVSRWKTLGAYYLNKWGIRKW